MNGERYATVLRNPNSIARSNTTEVAHSCSLHYSNQTNDNTNGLGANVYYSSSDKCVTNSVHLKNGANEDQHYNSDVETFVNSGNNKQRNSSSRNQKIIESQKNSHYNKEGLMFCIKKKFFLEPSSSAQNVDKMSISMPNVLAEDLKILCKEFEMRGDTQPPKSASGEDFAVTSTNSTKNLLASCVNRRRVLNDNMSEGSYHLEDPDYLSSQSDVGSCAPFNINPRLYSTNFTTKRVGNVIVKVVLGIRFLN